MCLINVRSWIASTRMHGLLEPHKQQAAEPLGQARRQPAGLHQQVGGWAARQAVRQRGRGRLRVGRQAGEVRRRSGARAPGAALQLGRQAAGLGAQTWRMIRRRGRARVGRGAARVRAPAVTVAAPAPAPAQGAAAARSPAAARLRWRAPGWQALPRLPPCGLCLCATSAEQAS